MTVRTGRASLNLTLPLHSYPLSSTERFPVNSGAEASIAKVHVKKKMSKYILGR